MRYTPPFQLHTKQRTRPPNVILSRPKKSLFTDDNTDTSISLTPSKYHYHLHDHYIHFSSSKLFSNICKVVICCIMLCMVTYYCLYITFFSNNTAFLSDDLDAQTATIEMVAANISNISNISSILNAVTDEPVKIRKQKRHKKRKKRKQTVGKHRPFPPLYVSDAPYYMDKNIVITGLVHNSGQSIDATLKQLESLSRLFNSTT
eukprot:33882_1